MTRRVDIVLLTLFLDASSGLQSRLRREEGQAYVEYAMVLLVAAALAAAVLFVRAGLVDALASVADAVEDAIPN